MNGDVRSACDGFNAEMPLVVGHVGTGFVDGGELAFFGCIVRCCVVHSRSVSPGDGNSCIGIGDSHIDFLQ